MRKLMDMDDEGGDMMMMMMTMTFGSWSDYELKIVWEGWDVKTKGQFALSWFAVVLMTIAYQGLKYWHSSLDSRMVSLNLKRNGSGDEAVLPNEKTSLDLTTPSGNPKTAMYEKLLDNVIGGASEVPLKLVVLHAALAAFNYALALILMLVAMTYNPSLFMALIVGYFLGDIMFFRRHLAPKFAQYEALNYQAAGGDCH